MKYSHVLVLAVFLLGITFRAILLTVPFIEDERKNIYINVGQKAKELLLLFDKNDSRVSLELLLDFVIKRKK